MEREIERERHKGRKRERELERERCGCGLSMSGDTGGGPMSCQSASGALYPLKNSIEQIANNPQYDKNSILTTMYNIIAIHFVIYYMDDGPGSGLR